MASVGAGAGAGAVNPMMDEMGPARQAGEVPEALKETVGQIRELTQGVMGLLEARRAPPQVDPRNAVMRQATQIIRDLKAELGAAGQETGALRAQLEEARETHAVALQELTAQVYAVSAASDARNASLEAILAEQESSAREEPEASEGRNQAVQEELAEATGEGRALRGANQALHAANADALEGTRAAGLQVTEARAETRALIEQTEELRAELREVKNESAHVRETMRGMSQQLAESNQRLESSGRARSLADGRLQALLAAIPGLANMIRDTNAQMTEASHAAQVPVEEDMDLAALQRELV